MQQLDPMRAPRSTWITPPTSYRACQLCVHGLIVEGELSCTAPRVVDLRCAVPVAQARSFGGGCGPDANHLMLSAELEPVA